MNAGTKIGTDIYYQKAKQQGWRARSAFKLIHIDENFHILKGVTKAVDLCASPGSWSQVLSRKLYMKEDLSFQPPHSVLFSDLKPSRPIIEDDVDQDGPDENVKIIAVDLQPMAPLPGVIQIQGDITDITTAEKIINCFDGGQADLVICDGSHEVTGLHNMDLHFQGQLILGAIHIAVNVLRKGGTFVSKMFKPRRPTHRNMLRKQLLCLFDDVNIFKPVSSRSTSREAFIVCKSYNPPEGFDPKLLTNYLDISQKADYSVLSGVNRFLIPYLTRGDVSFLDKTETATFELQLGDLYMFEPSLGLTPQQVWSDVKNGRVPRFPETLESSFPTSIDSFGELDGVMSAWEQREKETGYLDVAYLNELYRDFEISRRDSSSVNETINEVVNDDTICHCS